MNPAASPFHNESEITPSQRTAARIAGALYLLTSLTKKITAAFDLHRSNFPDDSYANPREARQTHWQDLCAGIRSLFKNPCFTVLLSLTFGLGLTTNLALWGLRQVLPLRQSSKANPDRLALIWKDSNNTPDDFASPWAAGPHHRFLESRAEPPLTDQVQTIDQSQTRRVRLSEAVRAQSHQWLALIFIAGSVLLVLLVRIWGNRSHTRIGNESKSAHRIKPD